MTKKNGGKFLLENAFKANYKSNKRSSICEDIETVTILIIEISKKDKIFNNMV